MPASTSDELPPLSNRDIEVLYDIVHLAQSLPGPPFRALFAAYDRILAKWRIDPDHDQIYFRFLFRMQEGRGAKDELLARFKELLARMDIEIEEDSEGEGIEEITRNLDHLELNGYTASSPQKTPKSRRSSFNSIYDARTYGPTWGADSAVAVDTDMPSGHAARNGRLPKAASDLGTRRRARSHSQSKLLSKLPIRGRVNGRAFSDTLHDQHRRDRSTSTQGSIRIHRNGTPQSRLHDDYSADESEDSSQDIYPNFLQDRENHYEPGEHYVPPEMLYRPTEAEMLDDAQTFRDHQTIRIARGRLRRWRDQALQYERVHDRMMATASDSDRHALLRQSFDIWRDSLQEKRQVVETERFYARMEQRSDKARDMYLMLKAFTHWAQYASDQVYRTSLARRHILRTRYFNAWRDVTVVNELKVRRHGLRKFTNIWKRRAAVVKDANVKTITFYREHLVYRVFWRWYWTFCESAAPTWGMNRFRRRIFAKWREAARSLRERENAVADSRTRGTSKAMLQRWLQRTTSILGFEAAAHDTRQRALLSLGFKSIQQQAKLHPKELKVKQMVLHRIVKTAIRAWHFRTQQSRQAAHVDKLRIMHNAWTAWNDQLRSKALNLRIDERVLMATLHKWVMSSRAAVLIRVHESQLAQRTFTQWFHNARARRTTLEYRERSLFTARQIKLMGSCFSKLRNAAQFRQNQANLALSVRQPRLIQRTFRSLIERHQYVSQLDSWADDAQFYVLTTNMLKRWREATQHSRRVRRRENYSIVRRTVKLNRTKRAFSSWRDKTARLGIQGRQAVEMAENHVLRSATQCLVQWNNRSRANTQFEQQAMAIRSTHLYRRSFSSLVQRHQDLQDLNRQALVIHQQNIDIAAPTYLKKLEWRIFQLNRSDQNALALLERTREKHIRAMLRFWAEQAKQRRVDRFVSPSPTPQHDGAFNDARGVGEGDDAYETDMMADIDDTIARNENWTAFEDPDLDLSFSISPPEVAPVYDTAAEGASTSYVHPAGLESQANPHPPFLTSTPLPGYLRTPSKRSVARLKARDRLANSGALPLNHGAASAPVVRFRDPVEGAGARRVTDFERRLREQGFGTRAGYRGRGAKRGRGEVRFEDIEE